MISTGGPGGALLPALLTGLAVAVALGVPGPAAARLVLALPAPRAAGPAGAARLRLRRPPALPLALLGGLVALTVSGPALAVVAGALVASGLAAARRRGQAAQARRERAGAGEACGVLAAELRAGRSPGAALDAAAQVACGALQVRLRAAAAATAFGGDVAPALLTGPPTTVPEVTAGLAACWRVCGGTGSGLAAAVERLEEGVRSADASRRAVEAELAGPRATAALLAVLPLGGIALAAGLGARPLHVLLETPLGGVCLVLGVGLDLLGLAWTRRIARAATG